MGTVEHSGKYVRIKYWYDMKMWNDTRVRNVVTMGLITETEYTDITGNEY